MSVLAQSSLTADPFRFVWHPEVWLLVAFLIGAYVYMVRVIGPHAVPVGQPPVSRRQWCCFVAAMVMLWAASDWPIHDLGEQYLYSVHMLQHMMLSYFLPPLVLLATPEWLLRALIGNGRLYARGAMAVPADRRRGDLQPGGDGHARAGGRQRVRRERSAALRPARPRRDDVAADVDAGRAVRSRSSGSAPAGTTIYLFLQSVVPTVPAGWLVFAEGVVYKHYGEQPVRVWGISPTDDQQIAGAIMKVGGSMFLWTIVVYVFFKKFASSYGESHDYRRGVQMPTAEITGHDDAPLTTADVEREFARVPGHTGTGLTRAAPRPVASPPL